MRCTSRPRLDSERPWERHHERLTHAEIAQRRFIVICPPVYAPEHEFEPLYVPVIVIVVRLTCAVPVALDEHPVDIMLLVGISIAKVMSSPDIVPTKVPGIRPCMPEPEKLIGPVAMDPFSVNCHVIVPMPACPIMLPAPIELLESDAMPVQAPAIDVDAVGPDGNVEALPPHAAANEASKTTKYAFFICLTPVTATCTTSTLRATGGYTQRDTIERPRHVGQLIRHGRAPEYKDSRAGKW